MNGINNIKSTSSVDKFTDDVCVFQEHNELRLEFDCQETIILSLTKEQSEQMILMLEKMYKRKL